MKRWQTFLLFFLLASLPTLPGQQFRQNLTMQFYPSKYVGYNQESKITITVGHASDARLVYDSGLDHLMPPSLPIGLGPDLRIINEAGQIRSSFSTDIRPTADADLWELFLRAPSKTRPKLKLNWTEISAFQGSLYLDIGSQSYDLSKAGNVDLNDPELQGITAKVRFFASYPNAVNTNHAFPDEFSLYDPYPNPFNSTTTIRFNLPEISLVKLVVMASNGSLVKSLLSEQLAAGQHLARWDATNLTGLQVSSGIYFVRLEAEKHAALKKLLLIK